MPCAPSSRRRLHCPPDRTPRPARSGGAPSGPQDKLNSQSTFPTGRETGTEGAWPYPMTEADRELQTRVRRFVDERAHPPRGRGRDERRPAARRRRRRPPQAGPRAGDRRDHHADGARRRRVHHVPAGARAGADRAGHERPRMGRAHAAGLARRKSQRSTSWSVGQAVDPGRAHGVLCHHRGGGGLRRRRASRPPSAGTATSTSSTARSGTSRRGTSPTTSSSRGC